MLLGEGDREAYLTSLSLIMELDFDILVPWGSEEGQPYGYSISRMQAQERLSRIVDRLKAGENG